MLPFISICIASLAISASSAVPIMLTVCPYTAMHVPVSSSTIFLVLPFIPIIRPLTRLMSVSDLPKIVRKSIISRTASSSRIKRKARSGEKPLPTAVTTSFALNSNEGSVAFSDKVMVTSPEPLSTCRFTASFSSMCLFVVPSGPIRTPTRSVGILINVAGLAVCSNSPEAFFVRKDFNV